MADARHDVRRRAIWGVFDQGLSSLTNFGLTILVARSLSAHEFGGFALVLALYLVLGGISQGLTSLPLSVRYSAAEEGLFRTKARDASGTALLVGLVSGVGCMAISLFASRDVGLPLLALGTALPGLLLQDAWRFVFVSQGRPQKAVLNDGVWFVCQVAAFAVIIVSGHRSAFAWLVGWGVASAVAAVTGCFQLGGLPRLGGAIGWLREHQELAARYAAEAVVVRGSSQVALLLVALAAGLAAAGSLRGAQVLYSPLNSLYLGGLFVAVPEGVRILRRRRESFQRFVLVVTTGTLLGAIGWSLLVALAPNYIGKEALGATWLRAQPLLLPIAAQYVLIASTMGPQVGLRAFAAAGDSLRTQLGYALAVIVASALGAATGGARGAAFGIAAGTGIGVVIWWRSYLRRVGAEHHGGAVANQPVGEMTRGANVEGSLGL